MSGKHAAWDVMTEDGPVRSEMILRHEARREAILAGDAHPGLEGLAGTWFSLPLKAQYLTFGYDTVEELAAEVARRIPSPFSARYCAVYMLTLPGDGFQFFMTPVTGKHALPFRPPVARTHVVMWPRSQEDHVVLSVVSAVFTPDYLPCE